MGNMLRVLYISRARRDLAESDVRDILETSRRHNAAHGITGVLCYGYSYFMQIIEGPDEPLLELYLKITADRRHRDCMILYISPTRERLFDRWTMGYVERVPALAVGFDELSRYRSEPQGKGRAAAIMEDLMRRLSEGSGAEAGA